MAVKTALSEEEYLRTSFPGADQEFRDGELIERGMPDTPHSRVQRNLVWYFEVLRRIEKQPFEALAELRHRVRAGRYLIPDVSVHWPDAPKGRVPAGPPLIAIEILSPDDRMSEVRGKLAEYLEFGVRHIWLIDPSRRVLSLYDRAGLHDVPEFQLPEAGRKLIPSDLFEDARALLSKTF